MNIGNQMAPCGACKCPPKYHACNLPSYEAVPSRIVKGLMTYQETERPAHTFVYTGQLRARES